MHRAWGVVGALVDPQHALLLESAGVDTIKALRNRNPANLLAKMVEVNKKRGRTLVLVTHDPELAGLADEVISLRDGRMVDPPERGVPGPGS